MNYCTHMNSSRDVGSPPLRGGVMKMGGDSLPFREGGGGSTPPHYSPPLREGVLEQEGGAGGSTFFPNFGAPPHSGGESWGGDNLGGQISSIFVMGSSPPQAEKIGDFGS